MELGDYKFTLIDNENNKRIITKKYHKLSSSLGKKPLKKNPIYWALTVGYILTIALMTFITTFFVFDLIKKKFGYSTALICGIAIILVCYGISSYVYSRLVRSLQYKTMASDVDFTVFFDHDGIQIDDSETKFSVKWAGIKFVEYTGEGVFILLSFGGTWLPTEKFSSSEEMKSFAELISSKIDHSEKPRSNLANK